MPLLVLRGFISVYTHRPAYNKVGQQVRRARCVERGVGHRRAVCGIVDNHRR